jgi:hypothetical protein
MLPKMTRCTPKSGPFSLQDKKRGGFVGSGPPKPPFAPMRGVGEGEKIYNFLLIQITNTTSISRWLQRFINASALD